MNFVKELRIHWSCISSPQPIEFSWRERGYEQFSPYWCIGEAVALLIKANYASHRTAMDKQHDKLLCTECHSACLLFGEWASSYKYLHHVNEPNPSTKTSRALFSSFLVLLTNSHGSLSYIAIESSHFIGYTYARQQISCAPLSSKSIQTMQINSMPREHMTCFWMDIPERGLPVYRSTSASLSEKSNESRSVSIEQELLKN